MENKKKPLQGYSAWTNPGNGFRCVRLHYTAHPGKRSDEWKRSAKRGMPDKQWATEMELAWETYAGEPVYGREFNQAVHMRTERFEPDTNYSVLYRGWDFGGNHSCVVTQYIDGTLYVIDEFPNMGFNTRRIAKDIQEECFRRYGNSFTYVDVIDPSGMWEGKTSTGQACADVMKELGMHLIPGVQEPTKRIDAVMRLLTGLRNGKPQLQLNPSCSMLAEGFKGGYQYPEKETQNQKKNRPLKNEFSHIHDSLQYVATKIDAVGGSRRRPSVAIKDNSYVFES